MRHFDAYMPQSCLSMVQTNIEMRNNMSLLDKDLFWHFVVFKACCIRKVREPQYIDI